MKLERLEVLECILYIVDIDEREKRKKELQRVANSFDTKMRDAKKRITDAGNSK